MLLIKQFAKIKHINITPPMLEIQWSCFKSGATLFLFLIVLMTPLNNEKNDTINYQFNGF
ncbi:hypothetical protein CWC05_20530 [Pseudoalteromonas ruthenica]|uniref:Uncharacterized protein n=1 Tax=Pseudoalteromonas ruthenica TaxID=151081 RepID=A0A5S3YME3_9GAMM|nr:hypothetical protein CWC05_20530 [Pseudoalteromonas ruthenica]